MQTLLFNQSLTEDVDDILWARAALRECLAYREHGLEVEDREGKTICFNCGGQV
jgi:hypothetical protein